MYIARVGADPPGVTAPAVVADWTVGCTVARSHGARAPTPRANRVSRVCVARSRVTGRPMVRMYIAHVGADPSGQNNPARSCPPTQDRICKCAACCGAGSRTLAFLATLVWHHGFKCSRPARGGRGNPRCGDATQSSLVDYDKLRQSMGAFGGGCRFWNVECRVYVLPGVAHVRMRMLRVRAVCADV